MPPENKTPDYIKFVGLAFQMMAIIALGTWIGYYFDQQNDWVFPVWLLTGCLISIVLAFYQLFKSLPKDKSS
jgi:F0F1-type ATP synthase assembly protein I